MNGQARQTPDVVRTTRAPGRDCIGEQEVDARAGCVDEGDDERVADHRWVDPGPTREAHLLVARSESWQEVGQGWAFITFATLRSPPDRASVNRPGAVDRPTARRGG
jgi:hypothetical protein